MSVELLMVNGIAALLIIFVLLWFFGIKPKAKIAGVDKPIIILVKDGIYQPSLIQVPAGKPITLQFLRRDASACAASVLFPKLNFSYSLPINQPINITLPPQPRGEMEFTCQMNMYRGKLVFLIN